MSATETPAEGKEPPFLEVFRAELEERRMLGKLARTSQELENDIPTGL